MYELHSKAAETQTTDPINDRSMRKKTQLAEC